MSLSEVSRSNEDQAVKPVVAAEPLSAEKQAEFEARAVQRKEMQAAEAADPESQAGLDDVEADLELLNYDLKTPKGVASLMFSKNPKINTKLHWDNYEFMFDSEVVGSKTQFHHFMLANHWEAPKDESSKNHKLYKKYKTAPMGGNGLTRYGGFEYMCESGLMKTMNEACREKKPYVPLAAALVICAESFADPNIGKSSAGALGIAQFMKITQKQVHWAATGKNIDGTPSKAGRVQHSKHGDLYSEQLKTWMTKNKGKDFRKNPEMAVIATICYLRQIYSDIESRCDFEGVSDENKDPNNLWHYALAGYNNSPNGAIKAFNTSKGDLKLVYKNKLLPHETREYLLKHQGLQRYIYAKQIDPTLLNLS